MDVDIGEGMIDQRLALPRARDDHPRKERGWCWIWRIDVVELDWMGWMDWILVVVIDVISARRWTQQ